MYADDDLNALLDGELDSVNAKNLRNAMVEDTALAERLEQLALADSILKTTYQEIDSEPLPDSVIDLLSSDAVEESNVVPLRRLNWPSRPIQIAAAMLLSVGLVAGTAQLRSPTPNVYAMATTVGAVDPQSALNSVLSGSNSAVSYPLSNEDSGGESVAAIMPVLSFKSTMGDWCREYTVMSYAKSARSLACNQGGQWQIVLTSAEQSTLPSDEYTTASTVSSAEFDKRIDSLIVGEPLSADQEATMIESGWVKVK